MLTLVTVEVTLMSRGGVLAELAAQTGEASRERLMEIARAKYFRSDKSYKLIYFSICVSSFLTLLYSSVHVFPPLSNINGPVEPESVVAKM